ncbi:MAG: hypothetical protein E7491_05940 [Ruminococcaceae bacterium]|nr:hypothetical protein [Oscillospiraceae bacterium]
MLAILFLVLSAGVGFFVVNSVFPQLWRKEYKTLSGKDVQIAPLMIVIPAAVCVGVVMMTWLYYLMGYAFAFTGKGMMWGAAITIPVAACICALFLCRIFIKKRKSLEIPRIKLGEYMTEICVVTITAVVSSLMMYQTFCVENGQIGVSVNVFSDFSPHIALIRSFSFGNNFPTQYPHFPDGTIRYHFMFQFLAGVLEYLGLELTTAFNLPSILTFTGFVCLLYSLAVIITGKKLGGILTVIFFFFRSSYAFVPFLMKKGENVSWIQYIFGNFEFIGETQNEAWGLWNQNVYLNQRHLALGMSFVVLMIILFYPHFVRGFDAFSSRYAVKARNIEAENGEMEQRVTFIQRIFGGFAQMFFCKEAWLFNKSELLTAVCAGFALGLASFFNGAMVIAALMVLFGMAVFSHKRLAYLITAVITVIMASLQSKVFMDGSAVDMQITVGFLAYDKSLMGILSYVLQLLGIFAVLALVVILAGRARMKCFMLCALIPFASAFILQMTPDIAVAHKYIMIAVILMNIGVADMLVSFFESKNAMLKVIAFMLCIVMTVTGAIDLITVYNKGKSKLYIDERNELYVWMMENTQPGDIFITDMCTIHPVFSTGRFAYFGWPYYAWSAGYDTYGRQATLERLFHQTDSEKLRKLAKDTGAKYIIIDRDILQRDEYEPVNNLLIDETFECIFETAWNETKVYLVE